MAGLGVIPSQSSGSIVNVPFATLLEEEKHIFKVDIPESFHMGKKNGDRQFYMEFASLVPEYYSKKAAELEMDPDNVKDVSYNLQLGYKWSSGFINKYIGDAWTFPARTPQMGPVLKSLNYHLDANKPKGSKYPLAFFDWIHVDYPESDMGIKMYHELTADVYYEEDYNEDVHGNALPQSLNDFPGEINYMMFPTTDSKIFREKVRIRMHIMPNASLAFSNDNLLTAMGFVIGIQVSETRVNSQFRVSGNMGTNSVRVIEAEEAGKFTVVERTPIKVYSHLERETELSSQVQVITNRMREANPLLLAEDINVAISRASKKINVDARLDFKESSRQFQLVLAEAGFGKEVNMMVTLYVDQLLAGLLGIKNRRTLTHDTPGDPLPVVSMTISEMEAKARTLVYDTGMVIAKVEGNPGNTTSGFNEVVLAALMPQYDGTLTTSRMLTQRPMISLSHLERSIWLGLYRYNEKGEVIPLQWKVRAYALGQLVGI